MMEFPPPTGGWSRDTRKQFEGNTMAVGLTVGPELLLLNLHFFNICRHHPTLKFKPHATDDKRYVSGIDGVPLRSVTARILPLFKTFSLRIQIKTIDKNITLKYFLHTVNL